MDKPDDKDHVVAQDDLKKMSEIQTPENEVDGFDEEMSNAPSEGRLGQLQLMVWVEKMPVQGPRN